MSVRVKICGVCRPEDAAVAAECGADYIGVILAPGYGRSRTVAEAERIFDAARGARRVGVLVDAAPGEVSALADRLRLDIVQLHGNDSPDAVAAVRDTGRVRIWKVVRPRLAADLLEAIRRYASVVDGLLLDGPGRVAGTGAGWTGGRFPWDAVAEGRGHVPGGLDVVVAGGLEPDNVASAIERLAPDVVDVSSGVESAPGAKDPERVRAFIAAARSARAAGAPVFPLESR